MAIRTTRLKTVQVPKVDTIDLSSQMDGETQTFVLGKKIPEQFETYLIWNSTIYKNTPSRTYYEITNNGLLRTYFNTAPKGGNGRNLALVVNGDLQGESPAATKQEVEEAIAEEAKNREEADEAIKFDLDVLDKKHTADLDTEIKNRADGDAENKTAIDAVSTELDTEKTTREEEDVKLQEQIDGIVNSTDVRDVVATYADLEAYDKSTLGDRDVIKVLADETHDGAISYYRFSKADNDFKFEGAVGPYYTKAEADVLLNAKQDTLVGEGEGQNIKTINGEPLTGAGDIQVAVDVEQATAAKAGIAKLYDSFGAGKDGSVTQYQINSRLNGNDVRIGNGAMARTNSVAIGPQSKSDKNYSAAIGQGSYSSRDFEFSVGSDANGFEGEIERYVANVKAGELDTDAVNKKQMEDYVDTNAGADSRLTDTGATHANNLPSLVLSNAGVTSSTATHKTRISIQYKNLDTGATGESGIDITEATEENNGLMPMEDKIKLNSMLAIKTIGAGLELSESGELTATGGESFDSTITAMGKIGTDGAKNNVLFGINTLNLPDSNGIIPAVAFGFNPSGSLNQACTMIGQNSCSANLGFGVTAVGWLAGPIINNVKKSISIGDNSVAVGQICQSLGNRSVRIGCDLQSWGTQEQYDRVNGTGAYSIGIGERVWTKKPYSIGIGFGQEVMSNNSIAIGNNAGVKDTAGYGAIAIGQGAIAERQGEVQIGVTRTSVGNVGYKNTRYRLITGVYPGENDNDAVNKSQMETHVSEKVDESLKVIAASAPTVTSIPVNANTTVQTITIPAGTWKISGQFNGTTGQSQIYVADIALKSGSSVLATTTVSGQGTTVEGGAVLPICGQVMAIDTVTSNTTVSIIVRVREHSLANINPLGCWLIAEKASL